MHCENISFIYHNEFNKYIEVEGVVLEAIFYYLFVMVSSKILIRKGKRYLHDLFEKWVEHPELN